MQKDSYFAITKKVKGKLPRLPFERIKNEILGRKYVLSVVFIGDKRSQNLNKTYRNKNKPANILSFPLSKSEGEIFINTNKAQKEAPSFSMNTSNFVGYLFIHGLLHLKGLKHGSTMEKAEIKVCRKFNINKKDKTQ